MSAEPKEARAEKPKNYTNIEGRAKPITGHFTDHGKFKTKVPSDNDGQWSDITKEDLERVNMEVSRALDKAGIELPESSNIAVNSTDLVIRSHNKFCIVRSYNKNSRTMEHELFEIYDEKLQRKGISKAVHRALIPIYEKMGVRRIEVFAALQNGGYTWARYGFRVTRSEALHLPSKVMSHSAEVRDVVNTFYKYHPPTARFPMSIIADFKWGEDALKGSSWFGSIDLTNKEERNDFYSYVGYKKR